MEKKEKKRKPSLFKMTRGVDKKNRANIWVNEKNFASITNLLKVWAEYNTACHPSHRPVDRTFHWSTKHFSKPILLFYKPIP
jgi:hypothetical protein